MLKNLIIIGLVASILFGWASIVVAENNMAFLETQEVYIRDSQNPEIMTRYEEPLYTEAQLKDRFETGKRVAIADWEAEKSGLYDMVRELNRKLEEEHKDNYKCVMVKK